MTKGSSVRYTTSCPRCQRDLTIEEPNQSSQVQCPYPDCSAVFALSHLETSHKAQKETEEQRPPNRSCEAGKVQCPNCSVALKMPSTQGMIRGICPKCRCKIPVRPLPQGKGNEFHSEGAGVTPRIVHGSTDSTTSATALGQSGNLVIRRWILCAAGGVFFVTCSLLLAFAMSGADSDKNQEGNPDNSRSLSRGQPGKLSDASSASGESTAPKQKGKQKPLDLGRTSGFRAPRKEEVQGAGVLALLGHNHLVTKVAFLPKGEQCVTASWDGTLRVWNLRRGVEIKRQILSPNDNRLTPGGRFPGTMSLKVAKPILDFALSESGRYLVVGIDGYDSDPFDLGCLDVLEGRKFVLIPPPKVGSVRILGTDRLGSPDMRLNFHRTTRAIAISPDGRLILAGMGNFDGKGRFTGIYQLNLSTGKARKKKGKHTSDILSLAFSPNGKRYLSSAKDGQLLLRELSGGILRNLKGHSGFIMCARFSHNGRYAVGGGTDSMIRVWELSSGKVIRTLKGHTDTVNEIAITPDGQRLLSASSAQTIRLWAIRSEQDICQFRGHRGPVWSVAISPDGRQALSGAGGEVSNKGVAPARNNEVVLWNLPRGRSAAPIVVYHPTAKKDPRELVALRGHLGNPLGPNPSAQIDSLAFTNEGARALSLRSGLEAKIRFWDLKTGKCLQSAASPAVNLLGGSFPAVLSPDGQKMIYRAGIPARLTVYNPSSKRTIGQMPLQCVIRRPIGKGRFQVLRLLFEPGDHFAFSHNGQYFICHGHFQTPARVTARGIAVWKEGKMVSGYLFPRTNERVANVNLFDVATRSVAISNDGHYAAISLSTVSRLFLIDLQAPQMFELKGHTRVVRSMAFSPDSQVVASGSEGGTIRVWNVNNRKQVRSFTKHEKVVHSLCFSPNSRLLLSGGADWTARLWDCKTDSDKKERCVFRGHNQAVKSVLISPDGKKALTGSEDATVRLWNLQGIP